MPHLHRASGQPMESGHLPARQLLGWHAGSSRQQQAEDGLGTDDHPSALTHMKLSQELTDVINQGNFLRGKENIVN